MIEEVYVSYETAKLLKEKGFSSDDCHTAYDEDKGFFWHGDYSKDRKGIVDAPTQAMVMKWLREVHSILIVIDYNYECTSKSYCYKIYHLGKNGKPKKFPIYGIRYDDEGNEYKDIISYRDFQLSYSDYATYEEAAEAAIYYCLEYII